MALILHNFYRSSASFRVRAALNLKGLEYEYAVRDLLRNEHRSEAYRELNPQMLVPALETDQGPVFQSLAIIEWLEETAPEPPLMPRDAWGRARVRSLAQIVAADVHPINNSGTLNRLREQFRADDDAIADWFRHWADKAMTALEARLANEPETGAFCHGDTPGIADVCLAAQVVNNERFDLGVGAYPTVARIHDACMAMSEFEKAHPRNQPDAR